MPIAACALIQVVAFSVVLLASSFLYAARLQRVRDGVRCVEHCRSLAALMVEFERALRRGKVRSESGEETPSSAATMAWVYGESRRASKGSRIVSKSTADLMIRSFQDRRAMGRRGTIMKSRFPFQERRVETETSRSPPVISGGPGTGHTPKGLEQRHGPNPGIVPLHSSSNSAAAAGP